MEITQDLLLKGKPTIIKGKEYLPTSDYVSPFFDEMSKFTDKFIIKVQTPNQITLTDGDEDMTYNRVWIQAVMPEKYCIDNHDEVYSLLYGLLLSGVTTVNGWSITRAASAPNSRQYSATYRKICALSPSVAALAVT